VNWWLAGAWFVACVVLGCTIYRQQWCKVRDYENWVGFCDHLHQAIGFALQPLPQAVADYLPICHGNCLTTLTNYLKLLNDKVDLTRARCAELVANNMLAEFLYQLGRTGRQTEQDKIMTTRILLSEQVQQAKRDLQTKTSIVLKLLIIIGIAGGILWI
jgi:hypothetical protein